MASDWLTGAFALVGAALGASVPALLNRRFQEADSRQVQLAELDRLIVGWEGPHARAAASFLIGLLDNSSGKTATNGLAELNLPAADDKLAEAKLLASRQMPEIIPILSEVEAADVSMARTFAEYIIKKVTVAEAMAKLSVLQESRSKGLKEIHRQIHAGVRNKTTVA